MEILDEIICIAKSNNISPQVIADRSGLDRKTVTSILSGDNTNPRIQTVEAIASVVGAEISVETDLSRAARSSGEIAYYRRVISDKQDLLEHIIAQHQKTEADLRQVIAVKNKWIERLFVVALLFIAVSVFLGAFSFNF